MRKLLDELYESIRSCEVEKIKNEKEIEKIKNEIEEVTISLNSSNNLSKLEKMKQQMNLSYLQSKLELIEMEKANSSNSDLMDFQNDIILKVKKLEENIYIAIRYRKVEMNLEILQELSPIYEYYKKISYVENEILNSLSTEDIKEIEDKIEKIKKMNLSSEQVELRIKGYRQKLEPYNRKVEIHKQKLDMLEELIDEMTAEVIREDMMKNNITLPEFVKGMRYFRVEDTVETNGVSDNVQLAAMLLPLLGGKENIVIVDNCTTRLRLEVKDSSIVKEAEIKKYVPGVLKSSQTTVQVIIGPQVEFVADELKKLV